jgi:hypothetical protein
MRVSLIAAGAAALALAGAIGVHPVHAQPPPGWDAPAPAGAAAQPSCADAASATARLVADEHWVDAHLVAETVNAFCRRAGTPAGWLRWNAVALVRLEEGTRAREVLAELFVAGPLAPEARTLAAWSFLVEEDEFAFRRALAAVEPAPRARLVAFAAIDAASSRFQGAADALEPSLATRARALHARYRGSRRRSPVLAGALSAAMPGAGQAYAGSWEGAAVALVLNALSIGATVELARREAYLSAALTGTAASIFYVGNILNAADLAQRGNQVAAEPHRDALERLLVPEAWP